MSEDLKSKYNPAELNNLPFINSFCEKSGIVNLEKNVTYSNCIELLVFLKSHKLSIEFFDCLYPSPSDPGAYFSYSSLKNNWEMTLGNHGWSGGIYKIDEKTLAKQIFNLNKIEQLKSLKILHKSNFEHYSKKDIYENEKQNELINFIHSAQS